MGNNEKWIPNGTCTIRELNTFVGGKLIITNLDKDPRVVKTNKLERITDMVFNLNELYNSDNLEDGRPSNTLFTYYSPGLVNFTHFKPKIPQYKKLKNGVLVSFTLRITDQNNNIYNGLGTTAVLHIR